MNIITREEAFNNLKKYLNVDLFNFAKKLEIVVFKNGKQNKGWKGLVLERLAGLNNNCSKASNGENFELKSVAFYYAKGKLVPKETMAITMINKNELRDTSFYKKVIAGRN